MVHNFDESLKVGELGEKKFLADCGSLFEKRSGRIEDFRVKNTGTLVELKTDLYCPQKAYKEIGYTPPIVLPEGCKDWTNNFVIERYSNKNVKNNGGPWQSWEKKIPIFIYQFLHTSFRIIFDTEMLLKRMSKFIEERNPFLKDIINTNHVTQVYLVPIKYLIDLNSIIFIQGDKDEKFGNSSSSVHPFPNRRKRPN